MSQTTTFALRTDDADWIERNDATIDETGRVFVQVPADEVEKITVSGRPWLRHTFADVPADAMNAATSCPAEWVEAPEVTAERPEALDGRALFLAKARAAGFIR
jgi:hypothetical protein